VITDTAGLAISTGLWIASTYAVLRLQARLIESFPDIWRSHSAVAAAYRETVQLRTPDVIGSRQSLVGFAVLFIFFLLLALFDVSLVVQLGTAVAFAIAWTVADVRGSRQVTATLEASGELPKLPRRDYLTLLYVGASALAWIGFLGAACFAGRLVGDLVG
jgi:hypothetical protein